MSRPALCSLDRLEVLLGAEGITDRPGAEARLEDASEVVRAYANTDWLNDDGDELEDVPPQVANIVAQMVERATRNRDGVTFEASGPFSRSFGADAAQRLYLTKNDRMVIRRAVGRTGIGTLATSRGRLETAAVDDRYGSSLVAEDLPPLPAGWPQ
jgi:hypothetical protein